MHHRHHPDRAEPVEDPTVSTLTSWIRRLSPYATGNLLQPQVDRGFGQNKKRRVASLKNQTKQQAPQITCRISRAAELTLGPVTGFNFKSVHAWPESGGIGVCLIEFLCLGGRREIVLDHRYSRGFARLHFLGGKAPPLHPPPQLLRQGLRLPVPGKTQKRLSPQSVHPVPEWHGLMARPWCRR